MVGFKRLCSDISKGLIGFKDVSLITTVINTFAVGMVSARIKQFSCVLEMA